MIQKRKEYFKSKGCTTKRMISFLITVIIDIILFCASLCFMILGIIEITQKFKDFLSLSTSVYLFLSIAPFIVIILGIGGWIIFKPKNALKSLGISMIAIVSLFSAILTIWTAVTLFSFSFNWDSENVIQKRIEIEKNNHCCFYHSTDKNKETNEFIMKEIFTDCPFSSEFEIMNNTCQKSGVTEYCQINLVDKNNNTSNSTNGNSTQNKDGNAELLCNRYLNSNPFALIGILFCDFCYMGRSLTLLFIWMCKQRKKIMKNLRETHMNNDSQRKNTFENDENDISMTDEIQNIIIKE